MALVITPLRVKYVGTLEVKETIHTANAMLVPNQPRQYLTLFVIPSINIVINTDHDHSKVMLTVVEAPVTNLDRSGSMGFVGRGPGLLSSSMCVDVFASPHGRQLYGAMKALPSKKGTILIITNYCVFSSFPSFPDVWWIV